MKILAKENYITSMSPEHKPAYSVAEGESFTVETWDCYGGKFTSESQKRHDVQIDHINPATGPIYIEGIKSGDMLRINILDIEVNEYGVMVLYPGMGPAGHLVTETDTRILPVKDNTIVFSPSLKIPLKPMIGVIGTAPKEESVLCSTPGSHGGNLDTKLIAAGHTVYLPAFHNGGLLALGDLHAAMGDGELDGSGVEIGGRVTMQASKAKSPFFPFPIVETEPDFYLLASGENLEEAAKQGIEAAVDWIRRSRGVKLNDAYRLVSACCDVQVSQMVNPLSTIRIKIPKFLIPSMENL